MVDLRRDLTPYLPLVLTLTVVASLVEFFLLRLLLRAGALAPITDLITIIFQVLLYVGLGGLYVSVLASGLTLGIIAVLLWRPDPRGALTILLLALLVVAASFFVLQSRPLMLVYPFLGMAVLVLLIVMHPRKRSWDFAGALAVVLAIGTTLYLLADTNARSFGWELDYAQEVFSGGEILAVAAPILLVFGRRWRPLAAVAAVAAATGFYVVSSSPFVPLVAAWTVYLTYFLPIPVYAVALAALVYDLGDMLTDPNQRWMGYGLLFVVIGGRLFQTTYLAQLSILGALLLILPLAMIVDVYPRWEDEPQDQHPDLQ